MGDVHSRFVGLRDILQFPGWSGEEDKEEGE